MTKLGFRLRTGRWPQQDDLDRVNCKEAGVIGHGSCGWCEVHKWPRYQCLCLAANDWRNAITDSSVENHV